MKPEEEKKHALIVNDDSDFNNLVRGILEEQGFVVTTALTCEDAAKLLPDAAPDVVLIDMDFQDMEKVELCRGLTQQSGRKNIPSIVNIRMEESLWKLSQMIDLVKNNAPYQFRMSEFLESGRFPSAGEQRQPACNGEKL